MAAWTHLRVKVSGLSVLEPKLSIIVEYNYIVYLLGGKKSCNVPLQADRISIQSGPHTFSD